MLARQSVLLAGLLVFAQAFADDAVQAPSLDGWLVKQAMLKSWSADVLQTRTLESLSKPLRSEGRVWFVQPNRFRWELGDPPRTIAVRTGEELVVAYPRLKRVERYRYEDQDDAALSQALALLEVGLPSDPETFKQRYELLSSERVADTMAFELRPAAAEARRLIERIRLDVGADDLRLRATELVFPDGSRLRNEFSNYSRDSDVDPRLFSTDDWADDS